jgi:hypothetical protein
MVLSSSCKGAGRENRVCLSIIGTVTSSHDPIVKPWYYRKRLFTIYKLYISETHFMLLIDKPGKMVGLNIALRK